MPATLDLIAKKGITFNRYYVSYPLCCPSRVSLLDRPLRPQPQSQRQRPAERRLHRVLVPGRDDPQPRHLAAGRRLQDRPRRQVPQRLRRKTVGPRDDRAARLVHLVHDPQRRLDAPLLRLRNGRQRPGRRPVRRSGGLGNPRIRRPRRHRLPVRADQRPPLLPRHRRADQHRDLGNRGDAGRPAALSPARLHRPARRLPPAGGARAYAAPLRLVPGRLAAARRRRRARRGRRLRQAPVHPRSRPPHTERAPHLPGLLPEAARVSARRRRRRPPGGQHARRHGPPQEHLHHLHLRQRVLLRRAPAARRQVPRLRAGDPPAAADPGAGDQAGQLDRRARRQHRHRPDRARTLRRHSRQEHRRSLARPVHARLRASAPGGRSCSSRSSKPATSRPRGR